MIGKEHPQTGSPINFACIALSAVVPSIHERFCFRMKEVFAPYSTRLAWLSDGTDDEVEESRDIRRTALCLMAAMVEAGDA